MFFVMWPPWMFAISYLGVKDYVHIKPFRVEGATHPTYTRKEIITHCNQRRGKLVPNQWSKWRRLDVRASTWLLTLAALTQSSNRPLISSMMQQLNTATNENADQWNYQIICISPTVSMCITCYPVMHQIILQLATLEDKCVTKRHNPDVVHF